MDQQAVHTRKVKEYLQRYKAEFSPYIRNQLETINAESEEYVSIYLFLQILKSTIAKDLQVFESAAVGAGGQKSTATEKGILSPREIEVLLVFAKGYSYRETAEIFGCKVSTIQTHAKRIYRKLKVNSRAEALYEARALGIVRP